MHEFHHLHIRRIAAMKNNLHIVRDGDKWLVKQEHLTTPLSQHQTQEAARQAAVPIAKLYGLEVVIHGRDNKIRDKDSYGNDPSWIKDTKH